MWNHHTLEFRWMFALQVGKLWRNSPFTGPDIKVWFSQPHFTRLFWKTYKTVSWKVYGIKPRQISLYVPWKKYWKRNICFKKKKKMKNSEEQKTFKSHVMNLCKKDLQEIWALVRLSGYLIDKQKCLIFNSVIRSQFNYYLIVYIFCSRQTDNTITWNAF